jgi:hypothetical protein
VKTLDFSKSALIRYESELVHHFRQLLDDDAELAWLSPLGNSAQDRLPWVELKLDAQTRRLKPVYFLKPSIPELESILATWSDPLPPLLVAPELIPRILDFCRQKRLAAVDLNGRAYLRAEGLLVDRRNLPGRDFRFELEPRNIFVGKSARIIRSLLTDRARVWSQSELVERTKASSGLVSRIVQHLISQGFIAKQSPREFRVRDPLGLIDAWVKADDFNRRTTAARYTAFGGSPVEIAHQLASWSKEQSVPLAFTQWVAGWLRHPYTEPAVTSAYVARLPEVAILERLGLRPVNDAGKVCLLMPDDEGVFLETQTVKDLPLASDAQIYLDLQKTGLRGPDQADALRHWEGFCRP